MYTVVTDTFDEVICCVSDDDEEEMILMRGVNAYRVEKPTFTETDCGIKF